MTKNAFTRTLSTPVPQSEQENPAQIPNNAGGYSFTVDDKARLERFLIHGTDKGTYYVTEKDLTKQNIKFLEDFLHRDPIAAIDIIRDVSVNGRAYRNSAAIFATAVTLKIIGGFPPEQEVFTIARPRSMPLSEAYTPVERKVNRNDLHAMARKLVREVCRTGTHLFEFAGYVELLGGWGRGKRSAVAEWYENKDPEKLAYQAVKYRQRNGWTHRDLMRLSHPEGVDTAVGDFILGKDHEAIDDLRIIDGFKTVQKAENVKAVIDALDFWKMLPWEALPTQFHKEPEVWKKLFYNGQLNGQALVRNITRLSRIHAFDDMVFAADYAAKLVDEDMIARTRLHPVNFLNALVVHEHGQVWRPKSFRETPKVPISYDSGLARVKDWSTVPVIKDALNAGFYLAFKHVEPAGKRTLIGLDVSGSMAGPVDGLDLSCAMAGAAMSMVVARTEPYYQIRGFTTVFKDLGISPSMNLNDIMTKTANQNFGGTDCSLPMLYALKNNVEVDTFMVYTDSETWAGQMHPHVALDRYRQKTGIAAKLVVCGMTATDITIANPADRGMLDVCGMDSNVPKVMADFSADRI